MSRPLSKVAPDWWDYTTLDREICEDAARLTPEDMLGLSRKGFKVVFYDTIEDFYLAEALEYIEAWRRHDEYESAMADAGCSSSPSARLQPLCSCSPRTPNFNRTLQAGQNF